MAVSKIEYLHQYNNKLNQIIDELETISVTRVLRFLNNYEDAIDTIRKFPLSSTNPRKERLKRRNFKLKFVDEYVIIYRIKNKTTIIMTDIFHQRENYQEYI